MTLPSLSTGTGPSGSFENRSGVLMGNPGPQTKALPSNTYTKLGKPVEERSGTDGGQRVSHRWWPHVHTHTHTCPHRNSPSSSSSETTSVWKLEGGCWGWEEEEAQTRPESINFPQTLTCFLHLLLPASAQMPPPQRSLLRPPSSSI